MVPITLLILFNATSAFAVGWHGFGAGASNILFIWLPLIHWWMKFPFGNHYDPDKKIKHIYPDGREENVIQKGKKVGAISGFFQGLLGYVIARLIFHLLVWLMS